MAGAVNRLIRKDPKKYVSTMPIKNKNGKRVGSFQVWRESESVCRGEWLEVDSKYQGRGYSEAAIKGLIHGAKKDHKLKEVRLMVPKDAAPAKHIYAKLGFTFDKNLGSTGVYGELEDWKLDLNKERRKSMEHENQSSFLEHHGVKGMKWGHRKDRKRSNPIKTRNKQIKAERKKTRSRIRQISDGDLDSLINRLEKEKKLKNLIDSDSTSGMGAKFARGLLSDVGKRTLTTVGGGAAIYAIKVAMTKEFNPRDAAII